MIIKDNNEIVDITDSETRVFMMTEKLSPSGETIDIETELCNDTDEATIKAERDWNHLAESDKQRTVISVILAALDESGKYANLDSWETISSWQI